MLPGLDGPLVSTAVARQALASGFEGHLGERARPRARTWMVRWWQRSAACFGPASSVRALFDEAAAPLLDTLGFGLSAATRVADERLVAMLHAATIAPIPIVVGSWSSSLPRLRTDAVRLAARPEVRWCLAFCGHHLTIIDTHRTYARAYLQFDLESAVDHDLTFALFWALMRPEAFSMSTPPGHAMIAELVDRSEQHRVDVCSSLHRGVLSALVEVIESFASASARRRRLGTDELGSLLEQALGVVYRILFLLFAEARRLVPTWHPTYRDGYTIEALRDAVSRSAGPPPGAWETLAAISRLAATGCATPELTVTAFDGDLFAPLPALRHAARLDDARAAAALTALSTTEAVNDGPRRPIAYDELGVEQLGAVYETVLDYQPGLEHEPKTGSKPPTRGDPVGGAEPRSARGARTRIVLRRTGGQRKASGTYYTPRAMTDYLVRRTLGPLTRRASPTDILGLRVVDPAMGSGAFLVSACRYLAAAYEEALIRKGDCDPNDIDDRERAGFRRIIAQRCLFGVDRNPMAVQLARLSLWLTTLASDRPLTFLNHHLRVGDSLIGASPDDLLRQPPGAPSRNTDGRPAPLPLFDPDDLAESIHPARRQLTRIAVEPGDSLGAVRWKRQALERISSPDSPLWQWRAIVDLWCACWFWPNDAPPPARAFPDLLDYVMTGHSSLPATQAGAWLAQARRLAAESSFFHWSLEFPEAFYDETGRPLAQPGFDAAIGNPPWNMVRADTGPEAARRTERDATRKLVRFCRQSGVHAMSASGQTNLYQLFLDRTLSLVRTGGGLGMVLPSGLLSDHGSAGLRRRLLSSSAIDAIVGFDNREGIFPIHRGLRFVALSARLGEPTDRIFCRFRERDPAVLDDISDDPSPLASHQFPVVITRNLLERISGPALTIPELCTATDVAIVDGVQRRCPRLGSGDGWSVKFGRELNATDDRRFFTNSTSGLPVLGGKQIGPFTVDLESSRHRIDRRVLEQRFGLTGSFSTARLAYRDVAASTNRQTLIATMLPADVVTTHTLFCVRSPTRLDVQWFVCGVLNSYVADYLVRLTVSTHVTISTVERLPVPAPPIGSAAFQAVIDESRQIARTGGASREVRAVLQARVALLYGLDRDELQHVLQTFPLVPHVDRDATSAAFARLSLSAR